MEAMVVAEAAAVEEDTAEPAAMVEAVADAAVAAEEADVASPTRPPGAKGSAPGRQGF